jgi:hypothetical protein
VGVAQVVRAVLAERARRLGARLAARPAAAAAAPSRRREDEPERFGVHALGRVELRVFAVRPINNRVSRLDANDGDDALFQLRTAI